MQKKIPFEEKTQLQAPVTQARPEQQKYKLFRTKKFKMYPYFEAKTAQNHTLWGRT